MNFAISFIFIVEFVLGFTTNNNNALFVPRSIFNKGINRFGGNASILYRQPSALNAQKSQANVIDEGSLEEIDVNGEIRNNNAEAGSSSKQNDLRIFGLSLTDPQDLITIFLSAVIIFNVGDLVLYYLGKIFAK